MARDEDEQEQDDQTAQHPDTADFYAHYETREILGKGMSSTVRHCIEKSSKKDYAVKILDVSTERSTEDQAEQLRLATLQEIRLLRMIAGHKYIIELHDFYDTPTFQFIVFELCRGGELFDYLTRVVTLSEKKARHLMRQVLEAVAELHARNIVHRDLKPENILMVTDDLTKLTDFGFAYELRPGEKLKELVGTPGYLAPEVLQANMNENADGYGIEVDLWAAGVILYTLLCGYAPFYHRKQIYMLRAISEGRFEFRSPEWDEISSAAKDLIKGLLTVDKHKRLTAKQALAHPFFQVAVGPYEEFLVAQKKFEPLKRFKLAILQVKSLVRLQHIKLIPLPITKAAARQNPYGAKKVRRFIDACAFQVYGHWVKKGREQYRDMLFANALVNATEVTA